MKVTAVPVYQEGSASAIACHQLTCKQRRMQSWPPSPTSMPVYLAQSKPGGIFLALTSPQPSHFPLLPHLEIPGFVFTDNYTINPRWPFSRRHPSRMEACRLFCSVTTVAGQQVVSNLGSLCQSPWPHEPSPAGTSGPICVHFLLLLSITRLSFIESTRLKLTKEI